MADSTFTTLGIVEESTYGTTPASALRLINVTDIQMTSNRNFSVPNVLTGDRRPFPGRVLQKSGGLVIPTILQYENTLELWEGLYGNARGSAVSITAATISFDHTTDTLADSGNGLGALQKGDYIFISGADDAGNNGWKGPILTAAAGAVTFPDGQITATHAAGTATTLKTRRLIDGTTLKFYSTEWNATSLTNEFRSAKGMVPTQVSLKWAQNEWTTEQWTLQGKVPAMANATIGTGAATAAKTTGYMTGVDDFGTLYFGSAGTTMIVSALELNVSSQANVLYGLGSIGPSSQSLVRFDVSVNFTAYYDDNARAFVDYVEANTSVPVWWNVVDPQGNKQLFSVLACKPEDGDPKFGAPNTMSTIDFKLKAFDPDKESGYAFAGITDRMMGVYFVPA